MNVPLKTLLTRIVDSGCYFLIVMVLLLLGAHLLRWKNLDIDGTTLALLGILLIIPLSGSLNEISIPGLFTAKIKPEEIRKATETVAQASE
jgi:hypothetical protein